MKIQNISSTPKYISDFINHNFTKLIEFMIMVFQKIIQEYYILSISEKNIKWKYIF